MSQKNTFSQRLNLSEFLSDAWVDQLRSDVEYFEKTADMKAVKEFAQQSIPALSAILAAGAIHSGVAYLSAKSRHDAEQKRLLDSYGSLSKHPAFQKNPHEFTQRFNELSLISPVVAGNPALAKKVITGRLKDGFNLEDAHRLSSIEYHTGMAPKTDHPINAAKAQALVSVSHALNYILPAIAAQQTLPSLAGMINKTPPLTAEQLSTLDEFFNIQAESDPHEKLKEIKDHFHDPRNKNISAELKKSNMDEYRKQWIDAVATHAEILKHHPGAKIQMPPEYAKKYSELNKKYSKTLHEGNKFLLGKKFEKKGTAMEKVSEACLGKMLADSHLMYKQAIAARAPKGMMARAAKVLEPSAGRLAEYFKIMAIPLTLAIGSQAVKSYLDHKNKEQQNLLADKVYANLKRTSEVVASNPQIADQAYDSLKSFAPALAVKPIIAKTFIENVVNGQGHLDWNTANMLATTQQSIQALDKHQGNFLSGLKEPLSFFQHKPPSSGKKDKHDNDE